MVACHYCNKSFKNNRGGQLTNHLKKEHGKSLRDHVIDFEYDGVPPKCICGICDEPAGFSRGKFIKYAHGHKDRLHKRKEEEYLRKNGAPKCQAEECDSEVGFSRGEPKKFCSISCSAKTSGFEKSTTHSQLKEVFKEKYGVDNPSKLPHVREKLSASIKRACERRRKEGTLSPSDETRKKLSIASKKNWEDESYRIRVRQRMKESYLSNPAERQRRSQWMKEKMKDPEYTSLVMSSLKASGRISRLHQKIREELDLASMGFESEVVVGRYRVDEIHEEARLIVEINGDYVHANPSIYEEDEQIRLRGSSYLARDKWKSDRKKIETLKSIGYDVIVIWESDDLQERLEEISEALQDNDETTTTGEI